MNRCSRRIAVRVATVVHAHKARWENSKWAEIARKVDNATNRINKLDAFHTEATKFRSTPGLRSIGWVIHSSPIEVSAQPLGYTSDWGLIQIDPRMIDEETFLGNKVFIGRSFPRFCPIPPFCRKHSFSTVMVTFR